MTRRLFAIFVFVETFVFLARADRWGVLFAAWLAAGLAFLPFGVGYPRNPENLGGRIRDVPVGSRVSGAYGSPVAGALRVPATLFTNALDYAGVLVWTPDPNPRDGVPGRPALHPLLGLAALLGFARAATRRTRGDLALLALAGGSLAAGVLSNPGGAPNTIRTCVFVPAALVAAAGVLATWASALARRFPVRPGAAAAGTAALVLALETSPFLSAWAGHPAVRAHFCATETSAARLARSLGSPDVVLEPDALRHPFVYDALAGPVGAREPIRSAARAGAAALAKEGRAEAFFYVARRPALEAFERAGFRVGRGVAPNDSDPKVVLARVAPARPRG